MPAFDLDTGKLLMQAPGKLFTSPNGHGGTLTALADCGALDDLGNRGVEQVFYFQVDNPLVRIAEPDFLGRHADARADVSCKVIAKKGPAEKMGCFVRIDGRCSMIEYSDVPTALAEEMDATGRLRLWAGNPAIHIFSVDFLDRLTRGHRHLPYHLARKTVTLSGPDAKPRSVNALKFEMFIFDAFPLAERIVLVETRREDEFSPLKNAEGPDSPPVVKQDISNLAARWLEQAGVEAPRNPGGEVAVPLEISPLFALDAAELATKVNASLRIDGPLYLS
jgi:UDP-N-acetylglucosamine/UDP-N-acetylgalactosamine diphosphorylase